MNLVWFQYLNNLAGEKLWLDALIVFGAEYLGYVLLAVLGAFVLLTQKRKDAKMAVFALASAGLARLVFTELIRLFYHHPRPFALPAEVLTKAGNFTFYQLISHSANSSFPSGHAAFFFGLAAGIYFFNRRLGAAFFAGAILIGLARVIAGIHWPYDIIGGAVAGITAAVLLHYLNYRRKKRAGLAQ